MRISSIVTLEHAQRAWAVLAKAAPTHPLLVLRAMRAIVLGVHHVKWGPCPDARALLVLADGPLRAVGAHGSTLNARMGEVAPLFAAALVRAGHFRAVLAPTLTLTGAERHRLLVELDTFMETHTTLPELHAVVRDIVRDHGYEPGLARQEKIGAVPWIVETDRGPVRVDPRP